MAFIDKIKEIAKQDKKTIVLPESMDKRTYEAAEKQVASVTTVNTNLIS